MDNNTNNDFIIEEAFERLAEINTMLESSDISLKDSMALYAEGVKLVSACKSSLEGAEKEIQILDDV